MTISYFGKNGANKRRTACIEANMNREEDEVVMLEKMARLLTIKGYDVDESVYGMLLIEVSDPGEYEMVVVDYKALKKSIALWKKFGF